MCWSGEASAVLATAGLGTTAYAAYRKEPAAIWMPLGYFSLMELLQAFTYSVIDQCSLPSNKIATLLGYLHITFQPFFMNAVSMHFIPDQARARILEEHRDKKFNEFVEELKKSAQIEDTDPEEACGCAEH